MSGTSSAVTTLTPMGSYETRTLTGDRRFILFSSCVRSLETYNEGMNKTQIKSLRIRIATLRAELNDPTCQRIPLARQQVLSALDVELEKARENGVTV